MPRKLMTYSAIQKGIMPGGFHGMLCRNEKGKQVWLPFRRYHELVSSGRMVDPVTKEPIRGMIRKEPTMKQAVVKSSTLTAAGRWDAKYHIAIKAWLDEKGLEENEGTVRQAMQAIRDRDTELKDLAVQKRSEAATLVDEARQLEDEAELTFPIRTR